MTQVVDVPRHRFVEPPVAGKQEPLRWHQARRVEEKLIDSIFAIRKPVSQKCEIAIEACVRKDGKMRGRVKRVVDRDAFTSALFEVSRHNRAASPIGQDQIIFGDLSAEWITRVGLDSIK